MQFYNKAEGNIFFIPLFLDTGIKESIKDYTKYKFDENLNYSFGRLILEDKSAGDLVEIFSYSGKVPTDYHIIIDSGRLIDPIHVSLGFAKNRWRFIFEDKGYDKLKDSDFANIYFKLGDEDNTILWKGGKQINLDVMDKEKYNEWIVYPSTKVEDMIKKIHQNKNVPVR